MQVALLQPNGSVSSNCRLVKLPDVNNRVILEYSGKLLEVHRTRVLSADAPKLLKDKALLLHTTSKNYGICPKCRDAIVVSGNQIECNRHGVFEVVGIPRLTKTGKLSKESLMTKNGDATTVENVAVIPKITDMGFEVWERRNVPFTDPNITLNVYVVVAENPGRKLCFNTYNGGLGKKKTMESLKLEEFQSGSTQQSYPVQDVSKERERLTKKGYKKLEC